MHESSHEGMVLLGVQSLMVSALIRVKQRTVGWASSVFTNACTTLLCRCVLRLFMCLLVQHDSRCRHVSFCWDMHRLPE